MKIMGIDISSRSTGWSIIEGDQLLEYGKINPTGKTMTSTQKMVYFHNELERIISRQQPDEIAIEDVVQVKSVSVTKILARFNGIALVEAYKHIQKEPTLFEPTEWKKLVTGSGNQKKADIQIFVCEKYGLLSKDKIEYYKSKINEVRSQLNESNEDEKLNIKDLKKQLRKADNEKAKELQQQIDFAKKQNIASRKKNKKNVSKLFDDISMSIYTDSSINEDIADATGTAIALQKNLNDKQN